MGDFRWELDLMRESRDDDAPGIFFSLSKDTNDPYAFSSWVLFIGRHHDRVLLYCIYSKQCITHPPKRADASGQRGLTADGYE